MNFYPERLNVCGPNVCGPTSAQWLVKSIHFLLNGLFLQLLLAHILMDWVANRPLPTWNWGCISASSESVLKFTNPKFGRQHTRTIIGSLFELSRKKWNFRSYWTIHALCRRTSCALCIFWLYFIVFDYTTRLVIPGLIKEVAVLPRHTIIVRTTNKAWNIFYYWKELHRNEMGRLASMSSPVIVVESYTIFGRGTQQSCICFKWLEWQLPSIHSA